MSSPSAARRVVVGRIVGAHGLRGQLRVRAYTDAPDVLLGLPRVTLSESEDEADGPDYDIEAAAPGRPGEVRLTLEGIEDRAAAEALRGRLLWADAERLEPLGPGEYYGYQLVGCRVEDASGSAIGTVRRIWSTGAPDVLVVEDAAGREQLIPAAEAFLRQVDVEARRIVVELVPGLLDPGPEAEAEGAEEEGE